ncbi:ABC transporter permease subunit [Halomicrobium sp. LC1Hm]|uniref:ABC transporter permease subunit n=1 Tax=Halomicrobium sp. LC1Hm TaxID=2610902 RepID=UPI0012984BC0|nr:ABC transporter permease subunit [Halomicrobium sp. LC1Hm]QGA81075.1 ABC-type transport system involved in multi-copper enzyme maturation, permease component [Halomicrobium sp. LC1Hm]
MNLSRVRAVAAQDFLDVRRARLVQGVASMYVLFVTAVFAGLTLTSDPSVPTGIEIARAIAILFVPLVALIAGYLAVAGERESGTIRFLLGYPVTRSEVVVGKILSRMGIVLLSILVGFVLATVAVLVEYPEPNLGMLWGFAALTCLFALSYVGVAIGISAATATRSRAMTAVISVYFVFTVMWNAVPPLVQFVANYLFDVTLDGTLWMLFSSLAPPRAFGLSLSALPGDAVQAPPVLGWETGVILLVLWAVGPILLGYWWFSRSDVE